MEQVKDLTETTVKDLWQGVKEQFWEDVNTKTLERVRKLLNNALEEELAEVPQFEVSTSFRRVFARSN